MPAAADAEPGPVAERRGVAACVVHYDGGELARTLEALHGMAGPLEDIVVVDNASTDGSVDESRRRFPDVRVLRLTENRGAAAARNAGFRATAAEQVLFLDNDVAPAADCLTRLRAALREHPAAALAMPRVLHAGRPGVVQYDGAGCHITGLMTLHNREVDLEAIRAGDRPGEARAISSIVSACFLLDRRRWGGEPPFHAPYFIYLEDHDLGVRARILGHEILSVPGARCLHGEGTAGISLRRTGRHTPLRIYHVIRNRWLFLLLNFSRRSLVVLAPPLFLFEAVQLAGTLRKGWLRHWLRAAGWIVGHLPWILARRREVQSRRRVPDREILEGGPLPLTDALLRAPLERRLRLVLERLLDLYWRLGRRLL